jgi:hypothetical protein
VKKEQNGKKLPRRLKPTEGCNASKRKRRKKKKKVLSNINARRLCNDDYDDL